MKPGMEWRDFPRWFRILGIIAFVNFNVFFIVAVSCGGDAWNGYHRDGKYFLANHGKYTEVSRLFWTYSYSHVVAVMMTHGSFFIAAVICLRSKAAREPKDAGPEDII
jgi:hypothetical protein